MIEITKRQLEQFEHIKTGRYGSVYRVNEDTAYKIYRPSFYGPDGNVMVNPSLKYPNSRLKLLKSKGKDLKYTDVFQDYIFMDGSFVGIEIPFYQGIYLYHTNDLTFPQKVDSARQMVRNAKELHHHFIYPDDYKLDNMILDKNGCVRFFDLDDILTKVYLIPNLLLDYDCSYGMHETILALFGENIPKPFGKEVKKALDRGYEKPSGSYSKMYDYIDRKNLLKSFIEIDENSDLSYLKSFLGTYPYTILYRIPDNSPTEDDYFYFSIIQKLREKGIFLFDFVPFSDTPDEYSSNFHTEDYVALKGKKLVKVKK